VNERLAVAAVAVTDWESGKPAMVEAYAEDLTCDASAPPWLSSRPATRSSTQPSSG